MIIDINRVRKGPQAEETEEETGDEDEDENEEDQDKLDELYAAKSVNPYLATTQSVESEGEGKKDFRRKVTQLKPRNLLDTSYQNTLNTSYSDQSSFNTTNNSKK